MVSWIIGDAVGQSLGFGLERQDEGKALDQDSRAKSGLAWNGDPYAARAPGTPQQSHVH